MSVSRESVFKMLKKNICNTEFEVIRPFASYEGIYPKHNTLEGKSTPNMITNQYSIHLRSYYHKRNIEIL